jgi:hypothetical protein
MKINSILKTVVIKKLITKPYVDKYYPSCKYKSLSNHLKMFIINPTKFPKNQKNVQQFIEKMYDLKSKT